MWISLCNFRIEFILCQLLLFIVLKNVINVDQLLILGYSLTVGCKLWCTEQYKISDVSIFVLAKNDIFQENTDNLMNSGEEEIIFFHLFVIIRMSRLIDLYLERSRVFKVTLAEKVFNFVISHFQKYFLYITPSVLSIVFIIRLLLLLIVVLLLSNQFS